MLPFGVECADRDAHHPAAIELRRSQPRLAGLVDAVEPREGVFVDLLTGNAGWFVAHAQRLKRNGREHLPFVISYVQLDEGPTLLTNIVECDPESVEIGMAVTAKIGEINGHRCIVWSPK